MANTKTAVHQLNKYDTGDNPGAPGLNFNVDEIEANLVKAAGSNPTTFPLNKILMRTDLLAFFINTGIPATPVWTQIPAAVAGFTDANRAEIALGKKFFSEQGLLPANIIRQDLYNFPAPDFMNYNGGSLARNMSIAKFSPGGIPANFGWALGGTYSKVLMIMGALRSTAGFYVGLGIGTSAVPATNNRQRGYHAGWEPSSLTGKIFKADGVGGDSPLVSENTNYINFAAANQPSAGVAIYVDDATGRVIFFTRYGSEQWWPVLDTTDGTYSGFQSCSFLSYATDPVFMPCPLGIYAE